MAWWWWGGWHGGGGGLRPEARKEPGATMPRRRDGGRRGPPAGVPQVREGEAARTGPAARGVALGPAGRRGARPSPGTQGPGRVLGGRERAGSGPGAGGAHGRPPALGPRGGPESVACAGAGSRRDTGGLASAPGRPRRAHPRGACLKGRPPPSPSRGRSAASRPSRRFGGPRRRGLDLGLTRGVRPIWERPRGGSHVGPWRGCLATSRVEGPRGHQLGTPHPRQRAVRPGARVQETGHVQKTRICRGNLEGPNGMFCRTVHNGAVRRVNHLSVPFHYGTHARCCVRIRRVRQYIRAVCGRA